MRTGVTEVNQIDALARARSSRRQSDRRDVTSAAGAIEETN